MDRKLEVSLKWHWNPLVEVQRDPLVEKELAHSTHRLQMDPIGEEELPPALNQE